MPIKLAVIIPTYDSLDTLKILIGQLKGFNIYVIEDGQKKETIKWLKKQEVKGIFHKENKGVAPSWNDGLKAAMKDGCTHFAILNDDIELPKNWWEDCREKFVGNVHMVCLDAHCPIPITGWFFIIDRHCIDKIGYFDEQFVPYCAEDDDYFIRYKFSGMKLFRIKLDVFHHEAKTINKLDRKMVKENKNENWRRLHRKYPNMTRQV